VSNIGNISVPDYSNCDNIILLPSVFYNIGYYCHTGKGRACRQVSSCSRKPLPAPLQCSEDEKRIRETIENARVGQKHTAWPAEGKPAVFARHFLDVRVLLEVNKYKANRNFLA
jgi:hypothetical protein